MKRERGVLAALLLVASLSGCAMCRNPFDYCGPVIEDDGCPNCDFGARRGSVFHPFADGTPVVASGPTPARGPEEVTGDMQDQPEELPAAERPGRRGVR